MSSADVDFRYLVRRSPGVIAARREVLRVLETAERSRPHRAVFYGLLFAAGLILSIDPTQQLRQLHGHDAAVIVRWAWTVFIVGGTGLSLWGTIRNNWRLEWYGLPLQMSAMGGLIVLTAGVGINTIRLCFICLILAVIVVMRHRWVTLKRLMRATEAMLHRAKEG